MTNETCLEVDIDTSCSDTSCTLFSPPQAKRAKTARPVEGEEIEMLAALGEDIQALKDEDEKIPRHLTGFLTSIGELMGDLSMRSQDELKMVIFNTVMQKRMEEKYQQ